MKINTHFIPVYVLIVFLVVLGLNYLEVPILGYDTGTVTLSVRAPSCGDNICSLGELDDCCIDCGCPDQYTCVENTCIYGMKSSFSKPLFSLNPGSNEVTLTPGETKELVYDVENLDLVNIHVTLSIVHGSEYISIDETEFWLDAGESQDFILTLPVEELAIGSYGFSIMGVSGRSTEYAYLDVEVVEPGSVAEQLKAIQVRAHFDLIWLVVPISIALALYLYYVKYKYSGDKKLGLLDRP
jgi:hypothetical protein